MFVKKENSQGLGLPAVYQAEAGHSCEPWSLIAAWSIQDNTVTKTKWGRIVKVKKERDRQTEALVSFPKTESHPYVNCETQGEALLTKQSLPPLSEIPVPASAFSS